MEKIKYIWLPSTVKRIFFQQLIKQKDNGINTAPNSNIHLFLTLLILEVGTIL